MSKHQTIFRNAAPGKPYAMILTKALQDVRLSPEAGWLLVFMLSQAKGWRFNIVHVAAHRRMGRDRLYAAIKELRGFGYCRRDESRGKDGIVTGYEYLFTDEPYNFGDPIPEDQEPDETPLPEDQEPAKKPAKPGASDGCANGSPLPEVPLPGVQDAYKGSTRERIEIPPSPPKGGSESDFGFDDFWEVYPKRVSKGAARKAFDRILKSGTATGAQMIEGAKAYAVSVRGKDRQFIAYPASWLNGERWTDELVSRAATKQLEHVIAKANPAYDFGEGPLDTQEGYDMCTARAIVRGEWSLDKVLPFKRPGVERCLAELRRRVPA